MADSTRRNMCSWSSGYEDPDIERLFDNNRKWVSRKHKEDPEFFDRLSKGQQPKYLYIGCSDSRVDANEILGLQPGSCFVHRNVANLVVGTDISMLSVLQFAVEVLGVDHILVVGHYGCGGVQASLKHRDAGLIENWLRNIRDVHRLHNEELVAIQSEEDRLRRLVELNVVEQCINLYKTGIVQRRRANAAENGQRYPRIHGFVYDIADGYLKKLSVDVDKYSRRYSNVYKLY